MITLTGAANASSALLAGFQPTTPGASHAIAPLSAQEAQTPAAMPVSAPEASSATPDPSVGRMLNEQA